MQVSGPIKLASCVGNMLNGYMLCNCTGVSLVEQHTVAIAVQLEAQYSQHVYTDASELYVNALCSFNHMTAR